MPINGDLPVIHVLLPLLLLLLAFQLALSHRDSSDQTLRMCSNNNCVILFEYADFKIALVSCTLLSVANFEPYKVYYIKIFKIVKFWEIILGHDFSLRNFAPFEHGLSRIPLKSSGHSEQLASKTWTRKR